MAAGALEAHKAIIESITGGSMTAIERVLATVGSLDASVFAGKAFTTSAAADSARRAISGSLDASSVAQMFKDAAALEASRRAVQTGVVYPSSMMSGEVFGDAASLLQSWREEMGEDRWGAITDAGADVAESLGIDELSPPEPGGSIARIRADEVAVALIVLVWLTVALDNGLTGATIALAKAVLESGRFVIDGFELADDHLPHLQNIQVWTMILAFVVARLPRRGPPRSETDDQG